MTDQSANEVGVVCESIPRCDRPTIHKCIAYQAEVAKHHTARVIGLVVHIFHAQVLNHTISTQDRYETEHAGVRSVDGQTSDDMTQSIEGALVAELIRGVVGLKQRTKSFAVVPGFGAARINVSAKYVIPVLNLAAGLRIDPLIQAL